MKFWDSSAILPLLIAEPTSDQITALHREDPELVVWWATPVECASALARLERENAADPEALVRARQRLRELSDSWFEVQPVDRVRLLAQRLLRVHNLRATDALQLSAALIGVRDDPGSMSFVCLDRRLGFAAEREGFVVVG